MRHAIVPVPKTTTLDEETTLAQLCRASVIQAEAIRVTVEEGVLEPEGTAMHQWRFPGTSSRRVRIVVRF